MVSEMDFILETEIATHFHFKNLLIPHIICCYWPASPEPIANVVPGFIFVL